MGSRESPSTASRSSSPRSGAAKAPGRRRPQPKPTHVHYVVAVTGWDFHWGLVAAGVYRLAGISRENHNLTFHGDVHRPTPFAFPRAEIVFSGRDEVDGDVLGTLDARGDRLLGYAVVPHDRLMSLVAAATRIRVVVLSGTPLLRRKARITGLSADTAYDPEDW